MVCCIMSENVRCFAIQSLFFFWQAVRLKEKGVASEIVAISCGPAKSEVMAESKRLNSTKMWKN